MIDTYSNEYRLTHSSIIKPTINNPKISLKDTNRYIIGKNKKEQFLINNGFPIDTILNKDLLSEFTIVKKVINNPIVLWNISRIIDEEFFALAIVDNIIVAKINCKTLNDKDILEHFIDEQIMSMQMNLYISNVDVRPDFIGQGLCKPITSYMIKHLKRLGFDMLFIENASTTREGVPACICYYKAGIENNYIMNYKDHNDRFQKMDIKHCFLKPPLKPTSYFYTSDDESVK